MTIENYYNTLNLSSDSDLETIKKAFRKEIAIYHPDNNKNPEAKKQFVIIIEAFNVLSDPDKREHYDTMLKKQTTNKPVVIVEKEEEQYREWQQESEKKSKKYWDIPLTELLLLDIFLEPGIIEGLFSGTDDLLDGIGDAVSDIFDLF